jgi:hypothetical protein
LRAPDFRAPILFILLQSFAVFESAVSTPFAEGALGGRWTEPLWNAACNFPLDCRGMNDVSQRKRCKANVHRKTVEARAKSLSMICV